MPATTDNPGKPPCRVCGAAEATRVMSCRDADRLTRDVFSIVRCAHCGTLRTEPAFDDDRLSEWYPDGYHGSGRLFRRLPGIGLLQRFQQRMRAGTLGPSSAGSRLLDVGCGGGAFLGFMVSRGWRGIGIENTDAYAAESRNHHPGLMVYGPSLTDWRRTIGEVDAVTLWHVLEHTADPCRILGHCRDVLTSSGRLVVSVPNIGSRQAVIAADRWFHLDVPRHRWHFSEATLLDLLCRSGFEPVRVYHLSLEYNPYGWWQSLLNMAGCTPNFVYRMLKRGEIPASATPRQRLLDVFASLFLGAAFAGPAFVFSFTEALSHQGGTLTVIARKSRRS